MKEKVCIITGGSSGLGKAIALELKKEGAQVIISSRDSRDLEKAAGEIGADYFGADVTQESEMKALVNFAISKFGRIDFWINNAGIWSAHCPIESLDLERVREMMEVNLFGTIIGSRTAFLAMKPGASIVNVISTSGLSGRPNSAGYCATKWAARGFTESLREEMRPRGIKVFAVYPGGMKTHLFDERKPDDFDTYMEAGDVAKTIVSNLQKPEPEEELIIRRK